MQTKCVQTIFATVLLWQAAAYCQAPPPPTLLWVNCGGEGEKPCGQSDGNKGWGLLPANTPADASTSNSNDTLRCDKGLQIHYDSSQGQSCVMKNRLTVSEIHSPNDDNRRNQFDVIQADQPLTFAPILASHNSYSNYFDGAQSQFSTDQGYTITDQLQYGARWIRLDPWVFNDFQIKLCHSSNLTETVGKLTVTIDGRTLCDIEDPLGNRLSLDRSFIFAIKEIGHWLRLHPNEFVVIRIHDTQQHWGDYPMLNGVVSNDDGSTNAHSEPINPTDFSTPYYGEAVAHELGNMVYKNPGGSTTPPDYRFPSLRQLRAMGKQVIILSNYPSQWAFDGADGAGLLQIQYSPDEFAPFLCTPGLPTSVTWLHNPGTFAETGEDRTLTNPYTSKMMDAPRVKAALACGFNEIGLDFLGTLDQAPDPHNLLTALSPMLGFLTGFSLALTDANFQCDDFSQGNSCSTTDTRRDTMVWSWQPNQTPPGQPEPARISTGFGDPFGSWLFFPHSSTAPYLCAGPGMGSGFPDGTFPDSKAWYLTQAEGPWENGEDTCQSEKGADWHFWHPASALQNIAAWNTIHNSGTATAAWINHYAGQVQALPQTISFTTHQGVIPPARTIVVTGGLGGQLKVTSSDDTRVSVTSVPLYANRDSAQTSDNNDSGMYTVAVTQNGANLKPGNYTSHVTVGEQTTLNLVANTGQIQANQCCQLFDVTVNLTVLVPQTTVTTNPPGLTILVDGAPHSTPYAISWDSGPTSHTVDAGQPVLGLAGRQATFLSWSDGGAVSHQLTAASAPVTLLTNFDASYFLGLTAIGSGTVTGNGGGQGYFPAGSQVQIQATPQSGTFFVGFGSDLSGPQNPQTLTMNSPHNVTATFGNYAVVHIGAAPAGVNVIADGQPHATPIDFQWTPGSNHIITFAPVTTLSPGRQIAFTGWSDGDLHNPRTVTAVNGASYTPVFETQDFVTTSVNPPGSGQITLSGWRTEGSQLTLTATPNGGYAFIGFSGGIQAATSPQTVTLNGPLNVTANFATAVPHITFTGTVISDSDPSVVQLSLGINNTGLGAAGSLNVTLSPTVLTGSGTVTNTTPITAIASLAGGTSMAAPLTFNWPTTANRIRVTVIFSANNGAYQGSQTLTIFR